MRTTSRKMFLEKIFGLKKILVDSLEKKWYIIDLLGGGNFESKAVG